VSLSSVAARARELGRVGQAADLIPGSLLPKALAAGREGLESATTAVGEAGEDLQLTRITTVLERAGSGWELSGRKPLVPFGAARRKLVAAAEYDAEIAVVVVDLTASGVRVAPRPTIGRHLDAEVRFDRAVVTDRDVDLGVLRERLRRAIPAVSIAAAAAALGAMDRLLDLCVDQGLTRRQFGRPVGAFQAFQHRCAELAMERRLAEVLVAHAIDSGEMGDGLRARAFAGSAAVRAGASAIELNGGKAYLDDHPASLLYREARTAELRWGSVTWARRTLASF
jgi:alkylation response protein AidB-like acyl-CoA dehydrogenase